MGKKKKDQSWLIVIILLFVLVFVIAGSFFLLKDAKEKESALKAAADNVQAILDSNTQMLYVVTDDVTAGTVLEMGVNVELQECITALPELLYITEEDLGKTLIVDLDAYTPIMINMVTEMELESDVRELEIGVAALMLNQQINDYVDLRIVFPNGADYIVASKLKVKQLFLENSLFYTDMDEGEILTLSSAIVDAYTNTGTKLYLTKYVEPNLQEESKPNYPVSETTLALMASDPNIVAVAADTLNVAARQELIARLQLLDEDWMTAVADGFGIHDTAHATAFAAKQAEEALEDNGTQEVTNE